MTPWVRVLQAYGIVWRAIDKKDRSVVAIKKILRYHPNIDMEPFFEWGMEEEGEHTLKALPYIIEWFGRAEEAVADDEEDSSNSDSDEDYYHVVERKLSAIFQFAKAMPLLACRLLFFCMHFF